MIELKSLAARIEEESGFSLFRDLLLSYNEKFNLTSLTGEKEIFYKHFLDSAAGESFFPKGACVVEVGSGAGFPSVPLKLLRPDLSFTLLESSGKKCEFLRTVSEKLGLSFRILPLRAEEAGQNENFREKFDFCCARAVARLNTLLEYCLPLVRPGGGFVAYKGQDREELEEAGFALDLLGGKLEEAESFSLPEGMGKRSLLLIRKVKSTPKKYPRGRGKERNDPIGL